MKRMAKSVSQPLSLEIPINNAMAAMRAIDHASYALMGDGRHKISFDDVVEVMMETGHALPSLYRETSMGGLARIHEM